MKAKGAKRKENKFNAKRLPGTKLGTYIENRVNNYLKKKESGAGEVFIRVVSSGDRVCEVKGGMKARYVTPAQWLRGRGRLASGWGYLRLGRLRS